MRIPLGGGAIVGATVLVSLLLAGCTAGGSSGAAPAPASVRAIDQDFPDPDVVRAGDGYVAFATNSPAYTIQVATSPDLRRWRVRAEDALPELPAWATTGRTWAPDVSRNPSGGWSMYFTAQDRESGRQCIGVATAASVRGPYAPASDAPVVCPVAEGGAIDPAVVTDAGVRYLVWKTDGNCCGLPTWIELAPLSADGTAVEGEPTQLIQQTQKWEGSLVEAPTLVKHGARWTLLYSANDYGGERYAIGMATAEAITGPYTARRTPFLSTTSSGGRFLGPGGQDVVAGPDGDVLVFHSWDDAFSYRGMNVLPLRWRGDVPEVVLPRRSAD